jgi:A/G-specific adenine glycosylase
MNVGRIKGKIAPFRRKVLWFYRQQGREFPWRETHDPYQILISELMLQQTQTERVREHYGRFLKCFPNVAALARASQGEVLKAWQGLGYNRRALFLKRAAEEIVARFDGKVPETLEELESLPGIGPYTARAVLTFAFNQPQVFIETNIRTVFIVEFFGKCANVHDGEILPILQAALPKKDPRRWYYALMDYGVALKKVHRKVNTRSRHYVRQSAFKGSDREIRGAILRHLIAKGAQSVTALTSLPFEKQRIEKQLSKLVKEGFLVQQGRLVSIA